MKCLSLIGLPVPQYKKLDTQIYTEYVRKHNQLPPPDHYKGPLYVPTAGPVPHTFMRNVIQHPKRKYFWSHVSHSPEFEQFIDKNSKAMLFIIRDPRDMVVSLAHMIQTSKIDPKDTIALEPLLLDLIDGRQKNYIRWASEIHDSYPMIWEIGICNYFRQFLPFMKFKKCLTLRFEDLVGEKGGGNSTAQFTTVKRIAAHIGYPINDAKIAEVCEQLFGESGTFREGQIGSWKKYFTPTVKEAFKAMPGSSQLLIELGYELDDQW